MGDSSDKLMIIKAMVGEIPEPQRLKSITVAWKVLESEETEDAMWLPCLHVEYYEGLRPKEVEVELSSSPDDIPEQNEVPEVRIIEGE